MSKTSLLMAIVILGLSTAPVRAAQSTRDASKTTGSDLQVLVDTIRFNRKALVAVNLNLTADEAAKFWPLYERYQDEISAIGRRLTALIDDYAAHLQELSNDKALQLMQDYLAAEADRVKVRQSYLGEFTKILPGRTVARFYQIENKIDAVLRYDLAETIPVVEQGSGAAPAK